MTDRFSSVELAPPIEVFAVSRGYVEDKHESKVNLGVGGRNVLYIVVNAL